MGFESFSKKLGTFAEANTCLQQSGLVKLSGSVLKFVFSVQNSLVFPQCLLAELWWRESNRETFVQKRPNLWKFST